MKFENFLKTSYLLSSVSMAFSWRKTLWIRDVRGIRVEYWIDRLCILEGTFSGSSWRKKRR